MRMEHAVVRVSLLGPVEMTVEGEAVPIRSRKMKSLLAMLALNANRTVPSATLVRELWPSDDEARSRNACHATVSRLRRLLAARGLDVIDTHSVGYRLRVDPGAVDVLAFDNLARRVETVRAQDPVTARLAADTANCMWRGHPLEGVEVCSYLESEAVRLQEQNVHLQLQLAGLMMEEGGHAEASRMLAPLTVSHFGWERVHSLYMTSLYAQGRQLEALEHYRAVSREMREQFGVAPDGALSGLHTRILEQDPGLLDLGRRAPVPAV